MANIPGRTRKKAEETAIQKALKVAKTAHQAAKEKADKQKSDAHTKAAEAAKAKYKEAQKAANRERWLHLGGARVGKTIDSIKLLRNCADARSYDFNADDVKKAFEALAREMDITRQQFDNALSTAPGEKKERGKTVFQF